jgi:hypothetical protein
MGFLEKQKTFRTALGNDRWPPISLELCGMFNPFLFTYCCLLSAGQGSWDAAETVIPAVP